MENEEETMTKEGAVWNEKGRMRGRKQEHITMIRRKRQEIWKKRRGR